MLAADSPAAAAVIFQSRSDLPKVMHYVADLPKVMY